MTFLLASLFVIPLAGCSTNASEAKPDPVTKRHETIESDRDAPPPSLFTRLRAWDFAENGDFIAIDEVSAGSFLFLRIDRSGHVVREQAVAPFLQKGEFIAQFVRASDLQWLVAVDNPATPRTQIRRIDVETGDVDDHAIDPNEPRGGLHVDALATLDHDGIVALFFEYPHAKVAHAVIAYDAHGAERYPIPKAFAGRPGLVSPKDLTTSPAGEIVVLEDTRRDLVFFARDGKYSKTIDLEAVCGKELWVPKRVTFGRNGEILVVDTSGNVPLWRLNASGTRASQIVPRDETHRLQNQVIEQSRIAPDGTVYTTDGHAFFALGEDGKITHVIGAAPE